MKWPVNQSQNCFNKRNLRGKLAKLDDFKGPIFSEAVWWSLMGSIVWRYDFRPKSAGSDWPGESPGRRCMSEVKPGELSITNLAIRSWDPVLWCNFVWVCLGWRKFTFHMDDSNLPYDRFIWIWQRFHKSSTQFRAQRISVPLQQSARTLNLWSRCSAAYHCQGWGQCRFPWGNRVEAVLFQLALRMGCTRLSLWRRRTLWWEVDGVF